MGDMAEWIMDSAHHWGEDCEDIDYEYYSKIQRRPRYTRFEKVCAFCNAHPLFWKKDNKGRWRLHDRNNRLHECKQYLEAKSLLLKKKCQPEVTS